ncbi:MAG: GNAT family N-acetyltransferase [Planctomycetales bacterium]|nr:GNAT family N-acetyltransferase [Planctomycetales bacterium]
MHVLRVQQLESLSSYSQRWDQLAGDCVFRKWVWLSTWWKHYQSLRTNQSLSVFLVVEEDCSEPSTSPNTQQLIAVLPCYLDASITRGKVLRLLGDGEVCSDHLGLLVSPDKLQCASQALAEHLVDCWQDWDLIDFSVVDSDDVGLNALCTVLESRACHINRIEGPNTWSIHLPSAWDEFLTQQSKSHRKQLRRLENRVLETRHGIWHPVQTSEEFDIAWNILFELHQRRRQSLGEPGCFSSVRWADFHRDVAQQLLATGHLRLSWLELGGQPVAAEYHLADQHTTSAYQGGIDPDRLDEEPGRLSMILTIQQAITEGHSNFDLLRGDEPYKPHWRATPHPTNHIQIVPLRSTARWRYQAWSYLRNARNLTHEFAKTE